MSYLVHLLKEKQEILSFLPNMSFSVRGFVWKRQQTVFLTSGMKGFWNGSPLFTILNIKDTYLMVHAVMKTLTPGWISNTNSSNDCCFINPCNHQPHDTPRINFSSAFQTQKNFCFGNDTHWQHNPLFVSFDNADLSKNEKKHFFFLTNSVFFEKIQLDFGWGVWCRGVQSSSKTIDFSRRVGFRSQEVDKMFQTVQKLNLLLTLVCLDIRFVS